MTAATAEAAADLEDSRPDALERRLITAAVMLGSVSTILSTTLANVAIPSIMGAFGMGYDEGQWLITGFLASMTASMLVAAWLVDQFGVRQTFIGVLLVYVATSLAAGLAVTPAQLIVARVIQGGSAGIMQPLAMVALFNAYPPSQRGRAMGIFGMAGVMAPAFGPTLAGFVLEWHSWRAVFLAVLPTTVLALVLGARCLSPRRASRVRPFDGFGFLLLCTTLLVLFNTLAGGEREGWTSGVILGRLALVGALATLFVVWQLRTPHPLLDLSVLAYPRFLASAVVAFAFGASLFGTIYIVPLVAQGIQGLGPTDAGLMLMPPGLVLAVIFPIAGRMSDRLPPALLVAVGLLVLGLSSLWLHGVDAHTTFWTMALALVVGRVGLGLVMPALNAGAVRAIPVTHLGQGAGLINFARQFGGTCGVNVLAVLLTRRIATHTNAVVTTQSGDNPLTYEWLARYQAILAHAGVPENLQGPGALHHLGRALLQQAYTQAFRDCFLYIACMAFGAILPALYLSWRRVNAPNRVRAVADEA